MQSGIRATRSLKAATAGGNARGTSGAAIPRGGRHPVDTRPVRCYVPPQSPDTFGEAVRPLAGGQSVPTSPSTPLGRLEDLKAAYGSEAARGKLDALRDLDRRPLPTSDEVLRLHEFLCFLSAYPDNAEVLARTERMLASFERRADLRRHRAALADTGIAGTAIHFVFFWFTAQWLARRWPDRMSIDWAQFDRKHEIEHLLHLMLPYAESPALDEFSLPARTWIDRLKAPGETDAAFLIRRIEALHPSPFGRETLYEDLGVPLILGPGPGTPARTGERYPLGPPVFQTRPLDRSRPRLRHELRKPPLAVRSAPPSEADRLIELSRRAMVTRARDLDNFIHADRLDVRIFDYGNGLQFACFGLIPERRLMIESVYGMLTLKNGVPIGYVLASGLFGSSEVMYNIFETYRGGESARIYGCVLSMARHLFGADTFAIDPFQLGHGNPEGQKSGAYWFYYKLGFRPLDPTVKRLADDERRRLRRHPRERSSLATLQKLSAEYVFLHEARPRRDVLGVVSPGNVGLHISRFLAERVGRERERGVRACAREAARLLGVRSTRGWTDGERLAWERWSPLVLILPGVERWPPRDRQALVRVVKAKGGRRESEFVRLFDRHRRLRRAVVRLAAHDPYER